MVGRLILIAAFYACSAFAWTPDPIVAFRKDQHLLVSPDSHAFIEALKTAAWPFSNIQRIQVEQAIRTFADRLRASSKYGDDLQISWALYQSERLPPLRSFPGAAEYFENQKSIPVFVATIQKPGGAMLGFVAASILKRNNGDLEAIAEYIVSPGGNGLGGELMMFLENQFAQSFEIKKMYAEMEWAGREYWARPQFRFALSPLQPKVTMNGQQVPYPFLMQSNFRKFLGERGLSEADLYIASGNSVLPFDWNKMLSPADIRMVKRLDGGKVSVQTLKSFDFVKNEWLDVGAAFLLSDYHTKADRDDGIRVAGKAYSNSAMPPWFGVIDFSCTGDLARVKAHNPTDLRLVSP